MKKPKLTQAFTIVELITVMVILMIVASMIVGVGRKARIAAMETKATSMIAALEVAISMYNADVGSYPPDDDGSSSSASLYDHLTDESEHGAGGTSPIAGWRGPYMDFKQEDINGSSEIIDPWNKPYNYDEPGTININSFDLWSEGFNDTDERGDPPKYGDDIYNW